MGRLSFRYDSDIGLCLNYDVFNLKEFIPSKPPVSLLDIIVGFVGL